VALYEPPLKKGVVYMDTVTFNLYEDLENVADSMLIESNTEIANLETDDYFVSLEV
jgi:hypothetical protein